MHYFLTAGITEIVTYFKLYLNLPQVIGLKNVAITLCGLSKETFN